MSPLQQDHRTGTTYSDGPVPASRVTMGTGLSGAPDYAKADQPPRPKPPITHQVPADVDGFDPANDAPPWLTRRMSFAAMNRELAKLRTRQRRERRERREQRHPSPPCTSVPTIPHGPVIERPRERRARPTRCGGCTRARCGGDRADPHEHPSFAWLAPFVRGMTGAEALAFFYDRTPVWLQVLTWADLARRCEQEREQ